MNTNVSLCNISESWYQLSDQEQKYVYYLSKAATAGGKIVFH
jgi:hypothetical protein